MLLRITYVFRGDSMSYVTQREENKSDIVPSAYYRMFNIISKSGIGYAFTQILTELSPSYAVKFGLCE